MASQEKMGDLNITEDELQRLSKALKNEEFRKMFVEYAEEISDPENRKRYEEEIAQLEREKGVDVQFVHPTPGYVLKTSVDGTNKAFVNVCQNEHIGKPSSERKTNDDGRRGLAWKIPHSFAPVRDDVDKNGGKCQVFDFVVHPDTYRMAETNERFKGMLHDTLSDGIKLQFDKQIDRKNLKLLNMKFKGTPTATVIRRKKEDGEQVAPLSEDDLLNKLPYPYGEVGSGDKPVKAKSKEAEKGAKSKEAQAPASDFTTPKYTMKHRSDMDMKDFCSSIASSSTRPKELVIDVELPLLKSAGPVSLDIFEKRLVLQSTEKAKYKLDIALPYPVDENEGSAKFDKVKRKLVITLPVIQSESVDVKTTLLNGSGTASEPNQEASKVNNEVKDKPLIEVMRSEEPSEDTNSDEVVSTEVPKSDRDVPLSMPDFSYNQTDETLTILLQVNKASPKSVSKRFCAKDQTVQLRAVSVGDGGFPIHYQLCLGLPEGFSVDLETSHQDVSPENVVFVLMKSDHCLGEWDRISVGPDSTNLEEKLLLTERTIIQQLDALDQQHTAMPVAKDMTLDLEVTEMNSDKLTVEIKDGSGRSRRKKHLSESADDIEVVHDKQAPKLHSILKQRSRTLSESSDELFGGADVDRQNSSTSLTSSEGIVTESDDSPDCPTGRKKSVSFSEQVDQTTYKINNSVSSMHSTIKNKRRRARKREQKQERQHNRRVRRTSGGSEPSSDEHATFDDDDDDGDITGNILVLPSAAPAVAKSTPVSDQAPNPHVVESQGSTPKADSKICDSGVPERTNDKQEVVAEPVILDENPGENSCGSAQDVKVDNGVISTHGDQNGNAEAEASAGESDKADSKPPERSVTCDNTNGSESTPCEANPDTVLNWKEPEYSSEHKTQCAIQLTNDVIFDLDTD